MWYDMMTAERAEENSGLGSRMVLAMALTFFAACIAYTVLTVVNSGALVGPIENGPVLLEQR